MAGVTGQWRILAGCPRSIDGRTLAGMTVPDSASEPTWQRDLGPYESVEQARAQVEAVTYGLPGEWAPGAKGELVLMEALTMAGVQVSAYEDVERDTLVRMVSPEVAQVIAGWLLRAHLAGRAINDE